MATLISKTPEETEKIGFEWGREAQPGWVIGLTGDLGAGKTQLVKGIARGLGSHARVHSPTFSLLNEYPDGRLPLFHLDLYRLDSPDQVIGAGLEEYLTNPAGVSVVEWIERWADPRHARVHRMVELEVISDTERRITYEDSGA